MKKNYLKKNILFKDIFSGYAKILGETNFTHGSFPEVGEKQKSRKKRKKEKSRWKNGQLRFVRHHVWRTQAHLDQIHRYYMDFCHFKVAHGSFLCGTHFFLHGQPSVADLELDLSSKFIRASSYTITIKSYPWKSFLGCYTFVSVKVFIIHNNLFIILSNLCSGDTKTILEWKGLNVGTYTDISKIIKVFFEKLGPGTKSKGEALGQSLSLNLVYPSPPHTQTFRTLPRNLGV